MPKAVYVRLLFDQQLRLCEAARAERLNVRELVAWTTATFKLEIDISKHTVTGILKREERLLMLPEQKRHSKTFTPVAMGEFDKKLASKVDAAVANSDTVAGRHIVLMARDLADKLAIPLAARPKFSRGWLYRFQQRNGIRLTVKHGEAASMNGELARIGRIKMKKLTDTYALSDIYNMDETVLYYRRDATKTLSRQKRIAGRKLCKDRLTLCLAVNADGSDKLPPLLIGTAITPICLRGVDVRREFGLTYTNGPKAWMRSGIFRKWLLELDEQMRRKDRKILLLVDNVSSHKRPADELTHVRLEFLPVNTTSHLQPLDQGIICNMKRNFYDLKADYSFEQYRRNRPQERVSIYRALGWRRDAWRKVKVSAIKNCWLHPGVVSDRRRIAGLLNPSDPMSVAEIMH